MKERVIKSIWILLIVVGVLLLLNSFSGITGFVVSENLQGGLSIVWGLVFIVGGILLFVVLRERESKLIKIIRTKTFEKAIKKIPKKPIESTIAKIGTGLAKQERLMHQKGKNSIRVSKGGRIIYSTEGNAVRLLDYLPDHRY